MVSDANNLGREKEKLNVEKNRREEPIDKRFQFSRQMTQATLKKSRLSLCYFWTLTACLPTLTLWRRELAGGENPLGDQRNLGIERDVVSCLYEIVKGENEASIELKRKVEQLLTVESKTLDGYVVLTFPVVHFISSSVKRFQSLKKKGKNDSKDFQLLLQDSNEQESWKL